MATVKYTLDPNNLPPIDQKAAARRALLTEEKINAAALSDLDNLPMTEEELARLLTCSVALRARRSTNLSQLDFANTYHFSVGHLRDLEQGSTCADSAILAYLKLIEQDPTGVATSLAKTKLATAA